MSAGRKARDAHFLKAQLTFNEAYSTYTRIEQWKLMVKTGIVYPRTTHG